MHTHLKNGFRSRRQVPFSRGHSRLYRLGLEVIKRFSCSAQQKMKFILLITVKIPTFFDILTLITIVGIVTFINMINTTSEFELKKSLYFQHYFYDQMKLHA